MCEYAGKLIAWLDCEISAEEAAAVERHLDDCAACRERIAAYRRTSADFKAYYDAVVEAKVRHPVPRGLLAASCAAAIAAVVVLALSHIVPRARVEAPPSPALSPLAAAPVRRNEPNVPEAPRPHKTWEARAVPGEPVKRIHARQLASSAPPAKTNWIPAESAIDIVIPAEAVFPPGSVPEGVGINANLTIAQDGSAQWLWLRP